MSLMRNRVLMRWTLPAALLVGCLIAPALARATPLPKVTVAITPSSATVGGSLESGAVNVAVSDTGVKEGAVILFKLKPGVTLAEVEAFAASKKSQGDPNKSSPFGSIVFDVEANPGSTTEAQTVLTAGEYVVSGGTGRKAREAADPLHGRGLESTCGAAGARGNRADDRVRIQGARDAARRRARRVRKRRLPGAHGHRLPREDDEGG